MPQNNKRPNPPKGTNMTTSPRFWNWMAKRYSRQPIANEEAYRHKIDVTQNHLSSEMKVLEFGCGTGSTALIHAPLVGHIDAIDFSEKMIVIAKEKAKTQGIGNVTFRTATIEAWQAEDQSYDVILGLSILHLLEDKEAVLAKVHQLLKPGGIFVSSTVCMAEMKGVWKWILPLGNAIGILPLVRTFSADELMESMQKTGFTVESNWQPKPDSRAFIVAKAAVS
jgi:2-polyprenyl-3-methyl-5-hydroxy-6-metoxy-1,4-benzoquinol methylase